MCLECLLHAPNSKIDIIFKLMAEKPKVSQLGEYQYSLNGHNVSLAKRGGHLVLDDGIERLNVFYGYRSDIMSPYFKRPLSPKDRPLVGQRNLSGVANYSLRFSNSSQRAIATEISTSISPLRICSCLARSASLR